MRQNKEYPNTCGVDERKKTKDAQNDELDRNFTQISTLLNMLSRREKIHYI